MLIRNSFAYLLARGAPAVLNFLGIALFTRLLSPEAYGTYALVLAITGFGNILFFEWLQGGLLRYRARYDEHLSIFLSTTLAGYLTALGANTLLMLLAFVFIGDDPLVRWLPWIWGLIGLWGAFEVALKLRAAEGNPLAFGILNTFKTGFFVLFGGLLAWQGYQAQGVIAGYIIALLLALLLFGGKVWLGVRPERVDASLLRQLFRYGLPLTATLGLSAIIGNTDRLLLAWLQGPAATGLYAAGYDLPNQALGVLLVITYLAGYPLAVRDLEQGDQERARRHLGQYARLLLGIGIPAAMGMAVLAPAIAHAVLGEDFRPSAQTLIPLITLAALLVNIKAYYFDLAFQFGQYTRGLLPILGLAVLLNIVLNLLLIPEFGLTGAAYATIAAQSFGLLYSALSGRRHFHLPFPLLDTGKILVSSACMATAIWPFRDTDGLPVLAAAVILGLTVYGLGLLATDAARTRSHLLHYIDRLRARRNP